MTFAASVIRGTAGDDDLTGTGGNDDFALVQGGNDTVHAGGGDDMLHMGATLNAGDRLDGGTGKDTVILNGDYSAGVVLDADTITNIEVMQFVAGHSYNVTMNDGNVAAGERLLVKGGTLGSSDMLTFDGSAELDGKFYIVGGAGDDAITGGAKQDLIDLTQGGIDAAHGGGGNDNILVSAAFAANDHIDGGTGNNTLTIMGGGTTDFTAGTGSLTGIERLAVDATSISSITMDDSDVAAGARLVVDYSASNDLSGSYTFLGFSETDGHFAITGPQAAAFVNFAGGGLSDTFTMLDLGTDTVDGGGGNDTFTYGSNFANQPGGTSSTDEIIGGAGNDTLVLTGGLGSYFFGGSTVFTMGVGELSSVQTMKLEGASDYVVKIQTGNVGFGATMTIDAAGATGNIQIDGSSLLSGSLHFIAGAGNQNAFFTGGANADVFDMQALLASGSVTGGGGDDIINFGGNLSHGLPVQGGSGNDTLNLDGDYSGGQFVTDSNLNGIETINFAAGNSYWLILQGDVTNDGSSTSALTVDGSALGASDVMTLDLSGATSPGYAVTGGAADDTITFGNSFGTTSTVDGGAGNDTVIFTGDFGTFFGSVVFGSGTLTSVETMKLEGASHFNIAIADGNVANGQTLTVDTTGVTISAAGFIEVDASAMKQGSVDFIVGNAQENQTFNGGANADTFDLANAPVVVFLNGNGGNDVFNFAGNFDPNLDALNGGAGDDTINLDGSYGGLEVINGFGNTFNIEKLHFAAGHSYHFGFANDVTDGGGKMLTVDGSALGASDVMTLDFTNATSAGYSITGGAGDDHVTMGASLHATDVINGRGGTNTLTFDGDLSAGVTLSHVLHFQTFVFDDGHSYKVTTADVNVASGTTLTVEGTLLTGSNALIFNGSAETDGMFALIGGAASDTLTGGAGNDIINGLGGADTLAGGGGTDTFVYTSGLASNSGTLDHITDFDPTQSDALNVGGGANFVSQIDTFKFLGTLDADISSAVSDALTSFGSSPAHFAVAVNFTGGDFAGHTYIVVDINGNAAYDSGTDLVVEVTGTNNFNIHPVTAADFI